MAKSELYGLIMAGGRGTRFWPKSRANRAKQVLSFTGEHTLIQGTVERLKPLIPPERIWIITNDLLRNEIIRQLPEVPKKQIIAEPAPRNTAPCIGLAAEILSRIDKNATLGVFPSDHLILTPKRFLQFAKAAHKAAARGELVTLGIQPRWPETGYGYVEFGKDAQPGSLESFKVKQFREKPDLATAKKYVKSGRFAWNSGMFFWRVDVILDALRHHLPKTHTLLAGLPDFQKRGFDQALADIFPKAENISIDYAVLEKAGNVTGIATDDFGWNDLGSWNAVYEVAAKDASANVLRGDVLLSNTQRSYVEANGKLVALVGVEDLVVVDTPDALLVVHRDKAQDVGALVKMLQEKKRNELL